MHFISDNVQIGRGDRLGGQLPDVEHQDQCGERPARELLCDPLVEVGLHRSCVTGCRLRRP
jgi:hypothetical protein